MNRRARAQVLPGAAGLCGAIGLAVALSATPALAQTCIPVAAEVRFCPEGTPWADVRWQDVAGVMVWDGDDIQMEFNPELTAATPPGAPGAALDALFDMLLAEPGAPDTTTLRRDSFATGAASVERMAIEVTEDGETYLVALMLADFDRGGPRLVWALSSFAPMEGAAFLDLTQTTAAALRHGTEH